MVTDVATLAMKATGALGVTAHLNERDAHGNNFSRGTPKMCMFMSKFKSLIYLAWAVLNLMGGRHFLNQEIYGTHKAHL